jgi:hypothetical protein
VVEACIAFGLHPRGDNPFGLTHLRKPFLEENEGLEPIPSVETDR